MVLGKVLGNNLNSQTESEDELLVADVHALLVWVRVKYVWP